MAEKMTAPQERALAHSNILLCKRIIEKHDGETYIIGVDPSLTATGISVLNMKGELIECIETGIKANSDTVTMPQFYQVFVELFRKYTPAVIAFEQVSVDTSFTGLRALLHVEAIFFLAAGQLVQDGKAKMPLMLAISPSAVKKYATGTARLFHEIQNKAVKRKMSKQAVKDGVTDQWGHAFATDNQADAFCISKIGEGVYNSAISYNSDEKAFSSAGKMIEALNPFDEAEDYHKECVYGIFKGKGLLEDNDYDAYKKKIETIRKQA